MIKKNLKPDKQNCEYAGLISRWTDLKVLRESWKRDLLNGERKTVNEYEQELEEKWKLNLFDQDNSESPEPYENNSKSVEEKNNAVDSFSISNSPFLEGKFFGEHNTSNGISAK